jgi:protein TonB
MLKTLLESRATKQRVAGGGTASVVFHVLVGSFAIYATATAGVITERAKPEKVVIFDNNKTPEPSRPLKVIVPPLRELSPELRAPNDIPDEIPEVDLTKQITNEDQWVGRGSSETKAGSPAPTNVGDTFLDNQVEKQAAVIPGSPAPRYPEVLTSAGIEGQVLVEFVIDTTGRADMTTFKVLKSDHEAFTDEVRGALPRMRFSPAEIGDRKVREQVQLPFAFALNR